MALSFVRTFLRTRRTADLPHRMRRAIKVARILYNDMDRCDLFRHAYSMAYVSLFSLVPSLAVVFAVISMVTPVLAGQTNLIAEAKTWMLQHLAAGSGEQVMGYLERLVGAIDIKKIGLTGFAGMVFTLILLLRQIEEALNSIFLVEKARHIFVRFMNFWTFLTLGTLIASLGVGILSGFSLTNLIPFLGHNTHEATSGLWSTIFPPASLFVFFTLVYRLVPNCFVPLKNAAIGAGVSAVLLTLASQFYGYYTARFTNYQALYGALAALPSFLFWLYLLWVITLFGAVVAWRSEQGFKVDDRGMHDQPKLTAREKARNHYLMTITPHLILLAIHDQFATGRGQGVSGRELSLKLNLPAVWVQESLESLLDHKYIVISETQVTERAKDMFTSCYFPTKPGSAIDLAGLDEAIFHGATDWLNGWEHEWPLDLRAAVSWLCEERRLNRDGKVDLGKTLERFKQGSG